MDWNGDGKHDWQDDAYYLLVLDEEHNHDSTESNPHQGEGSSGCLVVILFVLFVIYNISRIFS